jgi:ABC-type Fe3+-hydroxamate transport system substrate-binding protein
VRRPLLPLLLAALLACAGCGQATDTDDPPENSKPLKVQHALGVTKVPGQAKRPVALYPSELDSALALGVHPVGAAFPPGSRELPRYLRGGTGGIEPVGTVARPDLRRIEALDPDLILASKPSHEQLYDRLRRIAPTVVLTEDVDWKPNFRQDGEALGLADAAEKLLSTYDRRAADVRRLARGKTPKLPPAARRALTRPFIASIFDDVGLRHPVPRADRLPGARVGSLDEWTVGTGYLAAQQVLADLQRWLTAG